MTKNTKKGPAFLLKTYDMIQNQQFKQVIAWNDQGKGFFVHDPEKLALDVLPVYFKHSNMHSFIRQLNMYGFNKTRGKKSENYYFHPLFRKGQKNLIYQMQRKVQKKGSKKQCEAANPSNQNLSIELQQSQQNNKENKDVIIQKKVVNVTNLTSNRILQNQIRKKVVALLNINKCLMLEQYCHLNQLTKFNSFEEEDFGMLFQQQNKQLNITTNQYIKTNLSIWESIRAVCQKNCSGKKQVNETELTISKNCNNKYNQKQMEVEEKQEESDSKSIELQKQLNQQNKSFCQVQMGQNNQEISQQEQKSQNSKKQKQEENQSFSQLQQNLI